jgi:acyl-CoA thioesterase I
VFKDQATKKGSEGKAAARFPTEKTTFSSAMLRRRVLHAIVLAALPGFGWAQSAPVKPTGQASALGGAAHASGKQAVILVYGDSLSAEYGLARGAGWAALLEKRVAARKPPYSVENASISGETTSGGASRLPEVLSRTRPAVVVLELGGNDALRGLPLAMSRQNFSTMIEAAQKAGAKVVLAGMQMPPNYGKAYTESFRAMYEELAAKHKVALIPHFLEGVGEKRELFQADGIHPKAEAQPRMLDNVWPALEPLLAKK